MIAIPRPDDDDNMEDIEPPRPDVSKVPIPTTEEVDQAFKRVDCIRQEILHSGIDWRQIKPVPTPLPGVEIIAESDTGYLLWYWEEPNVWMALPYILKSGEEGECIEQIMKRSHVSAEPEAPSEYAPTPDPVDPALTRRIAIATAIATGAGLAYAAVRGLLGKK